MNDTIEKTSITLYSLNTLKALFNQINNGEELISNRLLRECTYKINMLEVFYDQPLFISRYNAKSICFFNEANQNMFEYFGDTDEIIVFHDNETPETFKLTAVPFNEVTLGLNHQTQILLNLTKGTVTKEDSYYIASEEIIAHRFPELANIVFDSE